MSNVPLSSQQRYHTPNRVIRAIDLFSGCGGSSLGATQAGVEVKAAVDLWPLARDTYLDNFNGVSFYNDRIENLDPREVEDKTGNIDLIMASPECTSHTCAKGNNPGSESSRMTAFEVLRFVRELEPRWVIIENVVHMKKWAKYKVLIEQLKSELHYLVSEQTLSASAFGVPQSRRRLFIICDKEQIPRRVVPPKITLPSARSIVDSNGTYAYSTLVTDKRASATIARAERAIAKLGDDKPFLLVYYGSDAAGGWQSLDRPLRTVTTLDRFAYVKPSLEGYKMRMLQVPEIRTAMGFPSDFKLDRGSRRDKIHLLGNAVCPPVMETIIRSLIGELT